MLPFCKVVLVVGLAYCIDGVGTCIKCIVRGAPLPGPGVVTIDVNNLEGAEDIVLDGEVPGVSVADLCTVGRAGWVRQ